MGRPKKPTAIKKNQGTLQKCRILKNEFNPEILETFEVPHFLTKSQKQIFETLAIKFKNTNVLTSIDLEALTIYCIEYDRYILAIKAIKDDDLVYTEIDGTPKQNPYIKISDLALKNVLKLSIEFGMTPAARTKVAAAPKEKKTLNGMLNEGFGT